MFAKWDVFNNLKTIEGLFQQVKVDAGGYGISWNDEIDLASEELRINGKKEIDPKPDEMEAIARANKSTAENGTVPHDAIERD